MTNKDISVLYVDDEEVFLEIIGELLCEYGFRVITAENGEKGIRLISEKLPDILLLDLYMPGMSGSDVLAWVHDHHPDLPVIIISGISDFKNAMDTIHAGAWDYLLKPIQEVNVLLHAIDRCLERSRLIQQNKEYRENLEKLVEDRTREMQRRGQILEAVSHAAGFFLKAVKLDRDIQPILERLGKASQSSRVHIFQNQLDEYGNLMATQQFEWTADGIESQFHNHFLKNAPYHELGMDRWKNIMSGGGIINGPIKDFPASEQALLRPQGILSLLVVPVFVGERWWGFIGFDDCTREREWLEPEIDAIITAANILGLTIERFETEIQLKSSLHEKEILLKEIHHRVKNNMAVMSSLLSLQANSVGDPLLVSAFRDSSARIRSMAMVHEKLYQSDNLSSINFPRYIASLVQHLTGLYRRPDKHIQIHIDAEDIFLNIVKAVPCGLIINELLSNSLKYAFVDVNEGEVVISFHEKEGKLFLEIKDDGVGLPENIDMLNPGTLGLQLVDMLTRQLNGHLDCTRGKGTAFKISFSK